MMMEGPVFFTDVATNRSISSTALGVVQGTTLFTTSASVFTDAFVQVPQYIPSPTPIVGLVLVAVKAPAVVARGALVVAQGSNLFFHSVARS